MKAVAASTRVRPASVRFIMRTTSFECACPSPIEVSRHGHGSLAGVPNSRKWIIPAAPSAYHLGAAPAGPNAFDLARIDLRACLSLSVGAENY